jgi:O-antigen biosynthesis protein
VTAMCASRIHEVSVVVASRDGRRYLQRCLPALGRSRLPDGAKLQIVVVDNGSRDGSPEWLRAQPGVEAVVAPVPLGFAHANNAARRVARGDVVAFLNNDTEVDPAWLLRPLAVLESDPGVAAVGSKLVFMHRFVKIACHVGAGRAFVLADHHGTPLDFKVRWAGPVSPPEVRRGRTGRWVNDGAILYLPLPEPDLDEVPERPPTVAVAERDGAGPVVVSIGRRELALARVPGVALIDPVGAEPVRLIQNAGSFVTRDGAGGDEGTGAEEGSGAYDVEAEVPSICGAALIARRSALDAAGWFPGYYTMYYEDTDLCLRLRQAGGRLVYCPASVVRHYHTGTNREDSPRFVEHVARSSLLFVARFGDGALLARKLGRRLLYTRAELAGSRGHPWRERWRGAHGTRGAVGALRALPRVLAERSWDAARARPLSEALLGTARRPYQQESEARP